MKNPKNLICSLLRNGVAFALAALLALPIASTSTASAARAQSASAGVRIVTGTKSKPSGPRMRGRFKAVRVRAKSARNIKTRDSGLLEEIIKDMNRTVGPKLPVDVSVSFAELGEANAYYSPRERQIVISYELLDEIIILFIKNADRNDPRVATKVAQQVIDTLSFVFYHEAAHAMIDLCELPITGREEDAADQLATVMVVTSANSKAGAAAARKKNGKTRAAQGGEAAINGALYFLLASRQSPQQLSELPFWDEHSLNEQRFYNIVTWVYGSAPRQFSHLVRNRVLPKARADRAPREYIRILNAWQKILSQAGAI